ncbi:ATP-NAD kinase-like domain-containing protein [Aspergillus avenaceus]|uniref:ATP-NAD kinase-like domain-containing protein n=1 Tax=Aspergillus avenaceus TaxID=36643 RepID=A0A5N6TF86_ASPAV|nr:ATP-NAD kinase-like domain-containing protein [Aspergillus avenaceus]
MSQSQRFTVEIIENSLRCYNERNEISLTVDDIVCILPNLRGTENHYEVVFLHRRSRHNGLEVEDCADLESIQVTSLPHLLLSQFLCSELPCHLHTDGSNPTNIHVVVSTASGIGAAKILYTRILKPLLLKLGLSNYHYHETQSPQTIFELCQSHFIACAEAGISQTIILLSGDGGVVDIIDAFYSTVKLLVVQPTIVLIPTGTGNATASSLGLMSKPTTGLRELLRGMPRPLPTFVAEFSPGAKYVIEGHASAFVGGSSLAQYKHPKIHGAVVASWGIHASLVANSDTTEYRKFGADRFKMAANQLLFPPNGAESHRYLGTVTLTRKKDEANREDIEILKSKEHMYMLVTLVPKLEKDFVISPKSVPLDGRLRVIHFGPARPEKVTQLMASAYQGGQHVYEESVLYSEIEGLHIQFHEIDEKWRRVCIDGKIVTVESGGWMHVYKEPRFLLNLLAPANIA